jgi:hypothetical protein
MAHIKNQPIPCRIVHPMDRYCDLYHTQIGGQMAPGDRNQRQQLLPQLLAQLNALGIGEFG